MDSKCHIQENSRGMGGLNNLSGDRKSWEEGGLKKFPSVGGMDIFWNYTIHSLVNDRTSCSDNDWECKVHNSLNIKCVLLRDLAYSFIAFEMGDIQ